MARFLVGGDFHIGRSSSLPTLAHHHQGLRALTAREAWLRFVDLALSERPDAVLLTGDLVNDDFGAIPAVRALRDGFERLRAAKIPTVVIPGNHDPGILRSYAQKHPDDAIFLGLNEPGFATYELLDGWTVVGWSYPPKQSEARVPWETFPKARPGRTIGMMHGTLGGRDHYAPFAEKELRDYPVDLWCLGHIHKPMWDERLSAVYPGSPQALDFGEPGLHGAALMTWTGSDWQHETRPLSTVRYEEVTVTVEIDDDPGIACDRALTERAESDPDVYWVFRARVIGERRESATPGDLKPSANDRYAVEFTGVELHPPVDWQSVSKGTGRDAICAQLYRLATEPDPDVSPEARSLYEELIRADLPIPSASAKGVPQAINELREDRDAIRKLLADACRGWVRP
jgi:DNA repair exonuclease SbcCD nuclease subunit